MTLLVGAVEQTLLLAMERGDLPRGDAAIGAEQIVAYLHGLLLWSKLNDDPARVADLARQSIAIALPGSR
jgi:hypothetical protein